MRHRNLKNQWRYRFRPNEIDYSTSQKLKWNMFWYENATVKCFRVLSQKSERAKRSDFLLSSQSCQLPNRNTVRCLNCERSTMGQPKYTEFRTVQFVRRWLTDNKLYHQSESLPCPWSRCYWMKMHPCQQILPLLSHLLRASLQKASSFGAVS